jgi:hypothetical protein
VLVENELMFVAENVLLAVVQPVMLFAETVAAAPQHLTLQAVDFREGKENLNLNSQHQL